MIPFTLHARLRLDGLAGSDYEYKPRATHYATYGDGGFYKSVDLNVPETHLCIEGYALPPLNEIDANEHIIMHVVADSDHSGVKQLDAIRKGHQPISRRCGEVAIPLGLLLDGATEEKAVMFPITNSISSDKAFDDMMRKRGKLKGSKPPSLEERRAFMTKGLEQFTKGSMHVYADFGDTPKATLRAYMGAIAAKMAAGEEEGGPLVFHTKRFFRLAMKATDEIHASAYIKAFGVPYQEDKAMYPIEKRAKLEDLILLTNKQDFGIQLPVNFFQARPPNKRKGIYAATVDDAKFANALVLPNLYRYNMSPETLASAVQDLQTGKELTHNLFKACCVLASYGTSVANTLEYASDTSIPHKNFMHDMQPVGSSSSPVKTLAADEDEEEEEEEEGSDPNLQGNERFDPGPCAGETNTADCEDENKTCTTTLATIPEVAAVGGLEHTPYLQHLNAILDKYDIFDVGALATASYPDTEGKSAAQLRSFTLPVRFDERDSKAKIAGHCHGLAIPKAITDRWLENGKCYGARARINHAPVDSQLPRLVLEPTGPIDPRILSAEEYGKQYQAEMHAIRELKHFMADNTPHLLAAHRLTGTPFHEKKPENPDQRLSMFYREVLHLVSPAMYEKNPQLAQFQVVDLRTGKRGVDYGTLLRDDGSGIALVSHLQHVPRATLERDVVPVMNVMSNMLPATTVLRVARADAPVSMATTLVRSPARALEFATDTDTRAIDTDTRARATTRLEFRNVATTHPLVDLETAIARVGHMFSDDVRAVGFGALSDTPHDEAMRIIRENLDRTDRTVYAMYSQPWRLAKANMEEIKADLNKLKEKKLITDYVFWRDRPLAQCSDTTTLALFLPVTPL